jgi:phosphatidylserine decarboxylase
MTTLLIISVSFTLLFVFWRFIFFFRNPVRKSSADNNAILSPADGHVLYLKYIHNTDNEVFSVKNERKILLHELMLLGRSYINFKSGWLIGIVMTPLDVHYNRSPIAGVIKKIGYEFPTDLRRNFNMFPALQNLFFKVEEPYADCPYLVHNERASYVITNERLQLFVTQIADRYIRKIVTYKDNVSVSRGEVFGLIRMGSQVDIFIPDTNEQLKLLIRQGEHLKAGESVIAYYRETSDQFPVTDI